MQAGDGGRGFDPPFDVTTPPGAAGPVVFNSPHSGAVYPEHFLAAARLGATALRRSEDAHVDALFAPAARACAAPLLRAHFPRAYLDVNREPYELDPRMFEGRLPPYCNTRSLRVAAGLGSIARVVGEGQEIYARRLTVAEGLARIEALYHPYHAALGELLETARRRFGVALLVDCHSMPSAALERAEGGRCDIVLGDRFGASAAPHLLAAAESAFVRAGYRVARNKPYAGGYITERYGRPAAGVQAVQIEVRRDLYMDERSLARGSGFDRLQRDLTGAIRALAAAADCLPPDRLAAE
ncbi:MAG: N-formylglutamate amidohydrolase [Methylobacteriaceae bacterium]|nr:N-formylglutamate amidohydrolase [Methylobacteriaceae bacterium]